MKVSKIIELLKTFDPNNELDISISRHISTEILNIPIVIKKQKGLEDWYRVERKEHSGMCWEESDPKFLNTLFLCDAARLSPRHCIEGSRWEMIQLCRGILLNQENRFKRCAIRLQYSDCVGFWSPKQGEKSMVLVNIDQAKKAAQEFLQQMSQDDEIYTSLEYRSS